MPTLAWPLRVAGVLAGLEGAATAAFGVRELVSVSGDRLVMGLTTTAFFIAYGAALVVCGLGLWRHRIWARGPVLFAQLVWLLLAWSLRGSPTTWAAVVLAVVSVAVLSGLLHPASLRSLEASREVDAPPQ